MKKLLLLISLFTTVSYAQCDAQATINDDFESYPGGTGKPLPECWSFQSNKNMTIKGIRSDNTKAHSGSNYIMIYTFFSSNNESYLISPELSTIDGEHFASFFVKASNANVVMSYGTMSDPSDTSTFTPVHNQNLTESYQEITSSAIAATAGHNYFVMKFTAPSMHTAIFIDDFEWKTEVSLSIDDVTDSTQLSYYPNPFKDFLQLEASNSIDRVIIYNSLGQVVLTEKVNSSTPRINTTDLQSGMYVVEVTANNQKQRYKVLK